MNSVVMGILSLTALPLLLIWLQGRWVRRNTPHLPEAPGRRSGECGRGDDLLRLLVVGESPAVGVGLAHIDETVSVQTAVELAALAQCRVRWTVMGYSGARLADLQQACLGRLAGSAYDLVLLVGGVNDSTSLASTAAFMQDAQRLLAALRKHIPAVPILLAGIPPLGDFPALPQPLSGLMGWRAGRLDLMLAALAAGDRRLRHLPCGAVTADEFAADGFHPDARASARWAQELAQAGHELLAPRRRTD